MANGVAASSSGGNAEVAGAEAGVEPAVASAVVTGTPPGGADLLTHFLPFDRESLRQSIDSLFAQWEELGTEMAQFLGSASVAPWLLATALAVSAGELARRRWEKTPGELATTEDEDPTFPWRPGFSPDEDAVSAW